MCGPSARRMCSAVLLGLVLVGGCSKGNPEDPKCYQVTGKVTFKGQPAQHAVVSFIPVDSSEERMPAGAVVDENGDFRLMTQKRIDGAEPGPYRITISWMKPLGTGDDADTTKELLPTKYQDPATSGLTFTVEPTENEVPPFDLNP